VATSATGRRTGTTRRCWQRSSVASSTRFGATTGKHYLLTAALPGRPRTRTKYYQLREFVKSLDWVNIMSYDFNVPGGSVAGPDTLFTLDPRDPSFPDWTWNTVGTVTYYLVQGVPRNKIVVGVPFYGNQYVRNDAGLYGAFDNTGLDPNSLEWDVKPQPSYHDLVDVAGSSTPTGTRVSGTPSPANRI
jgi:chitinase